MCDPARGRPLGAAFGAILLGVTCAGHGLAADGATGAPAPATAYSVRGADELGRHDYDDAIADFTQAARLEPHVAKHLYNRGVAYFAKGEDSRALADFDAALRLAPNDALALMARGDILFTRRDVAQAERDYDLAFRNAKSPAEVLSRHAAAYERAGLFEAAVRFYSVLIAATRNTARRA